MEAIQLDAVDRYVLEELTPQQRDEFEEHYFDCQECATDLRATAAFVDTAKKGFVARPLGKPASLGTVKPRPNAFWRPAILAFALAASLLVIVYQNVMVLPHFKTELAQLHAPEVLPVVSLVGANSRGGSTPTAALHGSGPFLLSLDIPTQDRFSSYSCVLYSPSGTRLWATAEISSLAAKDTVTINAPGGGQQSGTYKLVVQGRDSSGTVTELASYHFELSIQP